MRKILIIAAIFIALLIGGIVGNQLTKRELAPIDIVPDTVVVIDTAWQTEVETLLVSRIVNKVETLWVRPAHDSESYALIRQVYYNPPKLKLWTQDDSVMRLLSYDVGKCSPFIVRADYGGLFRSLNNSRKTGDDKVSTDFSLEYRTAIIHELCRSVCGEFDMALARFPSKYGCSNSIDTSIRDIFNDFVSFMEGLA